MKRIFSTLLLTVLLSPSFAQTMSINNDPGLEATYLDNSAALTWHATGSSSIVRYELQKSNDGINFSYVSSLAASLPSFTVKDNNLLDGINYYRIRMVDAAGNSNYSNTTQLNPAGSMARIRILPASYQDQLFIWLPVNTSIRNICICDASGRTIKNNLTVTHSTNIATLPTTGLQPGMYSIRFQTSQGETVQLRYSKSS